MVITRITGATIDSWDAAAIQRGLGPGNRGLAIVESRYQTNTSEDTVSWKRLSLCTSDLLSVRKLVMML
jgi:hypothetical protein